MKLLKKSLLAVAVAGTLVTTLLGGPAQAAESTQLSTEFVASVRAFWSQNAVPAATQDTLIAKLESGQPVDAQTSASPTSIRHKKTATGISEIHRFADGSVNVLNLEQPAKAKPGLVNPQAVFGCRVEATPMIYRRCTVTGTFTAVTLGFLADYQLSNSARATILAYDSPSVRCIGFSCSDPQFELIRRTQSGSSAAQVNLFTNYQLAGTGTTRLVLLVSGLSARSN